MDLDRVLGSLPGMVLTATPEGFVDFVNQEWFDYAGLGPGDPRTKDWLDTIHLDDLPDLLDRWGSIVASGEPGKIETRMRRFDGMFRHFIIRCSPVCDDLGHIVILYHALAVEGDDNGSAERSERDILNAVPAGIVVLTHSGELAAVNDHVVRYFGKSEEELRHWTTSDIVHSDDLQHVFDTIQRGVSSGEA